MKTKVFAIAMVLAALLIGVVPTAIAGIDGRGSEVQGTPSTTTTLPTPDTTGSDTDDPGRDLVYADDVIINGSLCAGFDCVNGENFGADTLRLKENNLRIHFTDTSVGSFPTRDWRIVINDTTNGGADYFAIEDADNARQVFKIEANAHSNSLYVDDGGHVGLGTSTPVVDLHTVNGNTPTVRLEQNGSSGFTAQTWDLGGNEANFFLRDVSNGSHLVFRVRPGAPENSLSIRADGKTGFGTDTPLAAVHVKRTDGTAVLEVEEASTTKTNRQLLQLVNNGGAQFSFDNGTSNWRAGSDNAGQIRLDLQDGAGDIEFRLDADGNLAIAGTLTENSDVNAKHDIVAMDAAAILASVLDLQVSEWSYNGETVRHIGPMAQDFAAAFGLGAKTTSIATRDIAGVALLSIQALAAENAELKARVDDLEQRLADLEAKVNGG